MIEIPCVAAGFFAGLLFACLTKIAGVAARAPARPLRAFIAESLLLAGVKLLASAR